MSQSSKSATTVNSATSAGIDNVVASAGAQAGSTTINLDAGGAVGADTAGVWKSSVGLDADGAATAATGATLMTSLFRNDTSASLGVQSGDEITISGVVGGVVKNAVFVVEDTSTLTDFMSTVQNTLGAQSVAVATGAVAATANSEGLDDLAAAGAVADDLVITGQTGSTNDITSLSITAVSSEGIFKSGI